MEDLKKLVDEAVDLLKKLISTPSFSKEEKETGDLIEQFLKEKGVETHRSGNNVWAFASEYNPVLPKVWRFAPDLSEWWKE